MTDKIKCPSCGYVINVEQAISSHLEAHYQADYEKKVAEMNNRLSAEKEKLNLEKQQLDALKEKQDELLKKKVSEALLQEKSKIEKETQEAFEVKLKSLEEENQKRKEENRLLKEKELGLLRKQQELADKEQDLAIQAEKLIMTRQNEIEAKAMQKEREKFEVEKQQLLKQIEDNKKLAEEMKRKAEQGSMQLQGEAQELTLQDLLTRAFPFDQVAEVSKGVRGADCILNVRNESQQVCGSIVFESKRTKAFGGDWITKLKQDQIACKADLAVIVTETMPSDMDRFGLKDGVWICSLQEARSLTMALRESLFRTYAVMKSQENKGGKMELLYAYLTSQEFSQIIRNVVENHQSMMDQLHTEKRSMTKMWAQREKQIWAVQTNVSTLFGAIQGIAGAELPSPDILELPQVDEGDDDESN